MHMHKNSLSGYPGVKNYLNIKMQHCNDFVAGEYLSLHYNSVLHFRLHLLSKFCPRHLASSSGYKTAKILSSVQIRLLCYLTISTSPKMSLKNKNSFSWAFLSYKPMQ